MYHILALILSGVVLMSGANIASLLLTLAPTANQLQTHNETELSKLTVPAITAQDDQVIQNRQVAGESGLREISPIQSSVTNVQYEYVTPEGKKGTLTQYVWRAEGLDLDPSNKTDVEEKIGGGTNVPYNITPVAFPLLGPETGITIQLFGQERTLPKTVSDYWKEGTGPYARNNLLFRCVISKADGIKSARQEVALVDELHWSRYTTNVDRLGVHNWPIVAGIAQARLKGSNQQVLAETAVTDLNPDDPFEFTLSFLDQDLEQFLDYLEKGRAELTFHFPYKAVSGGTVQTRFKGKVDIGNSISQLLDIYRDSDGTIRPLTVSEGAQFIRSVTASLDRESYIYADSGQVVPDLLNLAATNSDQVIKELLQTVTLTGEQAWDAFQNDGFKEAIRQQLVPLTETGLSETVDFTVNSDGSLSTNGSVISQEKTKKTGLGFLGKVAGKVGGVLGAIGIKFSKESQNSQGHQRYKEDVIERAKEHGVELRQIEGTELYVPVRINVAKVRSGTGTIKLSDYSKSAIGVRANGMLSPVSIDPRLSIDDYRLVERVEADDGLSSWPELRLKLAKLAPQVKEYSKAIDQARADKISYVLEKSEYQMKVATYNSQIAKGSLLHELLIRAGRVRPSQIPQLEALPKSYTALSRSPELVQKINETTAKDLVIGVKPLASIDQLRAAIQSLASDQKLDDAIELVESYEATLKQQMRKVEAEREQIREDREVFQDLIADFDTVTGRNDITLIKIYGMCNPQNGLPPIFGRLNPVKKN